MLRYLIALLMLVTGCSPVAQPESLRTVAAYEVPLLSPHDKAEFQNLLRREAARHGYHVDAATASQLQAMSEVSPITFSAAVWRGNDDEVIASAMDFVDHLGRVWITFSKGQDPRRSGQFRQSLVPEIQKRWPSTTSLPIMPSGAIPLTTDLIKTPSGYAVAQSAKHKYQINQQNP